MINSDVAAMILAGIGATIAFFYYIEAPTARRVRVACWVAMFATFLPLVVKLYLALFLNW